MIDNMMSNGQHVVNVPVWSPEGRAFTDFLMRVFPLSHRLTAAGEMLARHGGQTLARWLVLERIDTQPATVADIARSMGLARQGVQRLADALVEGGAARYELNARHKRAQLLDITDAGRASLRTIQVAQREWSNRVGTQLGRIELDRASALLDRALVIAEESPPDARP